MNVEYRIHEHLTQQLQALEDGLGKELMERLGQRAKDVLLDHFADLDQIPNKRGWAKQHFWGRIRKATRFDPSTCTETQATVVIGDPAFRLKVTGGTVRPKTRRMLAIPTREEAYGFSPSRGKIKGLFRIRSRGKIYLAKRAGRGAKGALRVYYQLTPKANIPRDPRALPAEEVMAGALAEEVTDYIQKAMG